MVMRYEITSQLPELRSVANSSRTSGSAIPIIVEFSGASMVASATVIRTAVSLIFGVAAAASSKVSSADNTDEPRIAVHLHGLTITDRRRRDAGADNGRNAVFPRHHGTVAENAARICHDRTGRRKQRRPRRRRRFGHQNLPESEFVRFVQRADDPCRALYFARRTGVSPQCVGITSRLLRQSEELGEGHRHEAGRRRAIVGPHEVRWPDRGEVGKLLLALGDESTVIRRRRGLGSCRDLVHLKEEDIVASLDDTVSGESMSELDEHGTIQAGATYSVLVGTLAHEYGHVLGLPDLFNTQFVRSEEPLGPERDSAGIGDWGLMGWGADGWNGDDGPNSLSAWSRMTLGWADVSEQSQAAQTIRMEPVATTAAVHRVPVTEFEFFLLEYRTRNSYYDRNIPSEGLLIWHMSQSRIVDLECADGRWMDAGFPLGTEPDPYGGEDNLDFWAHDESYAAAHGGNLGDATDPFDGTTYVAFAPQTNPASYDADQNRSVKVTDIHVDRGQMVAQVEATPLILSIRTLTLVDDSGDGLIIAGEPVHVQLILRNDGGIVARGVNVVVSSQDSLVEVVHGEAAAMDLEIGRSGRVGTSDDGYLTVRLKDTFVGSHTASLSLEIYVGEELVGIEEVTLTGFSTRVRIRDVRLVDSASNGDGRAQIGEPIRLDIFVDVEVPEALEVLSFDLRSLHPDVVVHGGNWIPHVSATTARIRSSEFMLPPGMQPGEKLPLELTTKIGGVATRKDTVFVEAGEGGDQTAPRVARLQNERSGSDVSLSLAKEDIVEVSRIASATAFVFTYEDTTEIARMPLDWSGDRYAGLWSDVPEGRFLVRAVVEDEFGNRGVGAFQLLNTETVVPAQVNPRASSWHFVGPPGDRWVPASRSVAFAPSSPGVVFATTRTALWRSADGGDNWSRSNVMLDAGRFMQSPFYSDEPWPLTRGVLIDAIDPLTVYLTSEPSRSRDGGMTWEPLSIPGSGTDAALLAADPVREGRLYARREQELWISGDGGDTWWDSGLREEWLDLFIHPLEPHWIYARGRDGRLFLSDDGGLSWTESRVLQGGSLPSIAADPRCPTCLVGTSYDDEVILWESADNGDSWYQVATTVDVFDRVRASHRPLLLYGHSSFFGHNVFRSGNGGTTWEKGPDLDAEVFDVVVDPHDPEHVAAIRWFFHGYDRLGGRWIRHSRDGGRTWTGPMLEDPAGAPVSTIHFTRNGKLYAGVLANERYREAWPVIYVSPDGGSSWETRGQERDRVMDSVMLTNLTSDPLDIGVLLSVTDREGVQRSDDDGETWRRVTSRATPTIIRATPTVSGSSSWVTWRSSLTPLVEGCFTRPNLVPSC